ncbi:hypothetical protein Tco_0613531 [Tanacetum coccineum]
MTFKVLLHHYGRFTTPPERRFVSGIVATIDLVGLDNFSTNQMKLILTNCLGYDENSLTFLYMKKPNRSLDSGVVPLADAIQDNKLILTYTQTHQNRLHVYISLVELSPLVVADQCKDEVVLIDNFIGDVYEIADHDQEEREYENEHEDEEICELFDDHELPVCTIRRFEMIKYSFGQDEGYVAIKEDEYEGLTNTSKGAIHTYQEIFRMMDEGWMDLAKRKEIDNVGGESTIWKF